MPYHNSFDHENTNQHKYLGAQHGLAIDNYIELRANPQFHKDLQWSPRAVDLLWSRRMLEEFEDKWGARIATKLFPPGVYDDLIFLAKAYFPKLPIREHARAINWNKLVMKNYAMARPEPVVKFEEKIDDRLIRVVIYFGHG
ncbi:hypothetical protein GYMLUDRAFT_88419 [Collybiopsis luxurians FD-317 M1]|uniref:Uncharacterized protein n=1 Tax=Collybiopsis luxurians FD-317 M1 TaxID=944289 RepID=A0A0D0C6E3_9AGAR|nr:hypothetical protein GYMLUDRAFT_88419 [Collybiopsis luxurians FD-317 M1]